MKQKEQTEIFEVPNIGRLMEWTNKRLMLELRKRAKAIAKEHNLDPDQTKALIHKSFRDIQAMRHRIH